MKAAGRWLVAGSAVNDHFAAASGIRLPFLLRKFDGQSVIRVTSASNSAGLFDTCGERRKLSGAG
jgi:hypothetical protein